MTGLEKRIWSAPALVLALTCLGLAASPAGAVEFPYTPNAQLSLTGDCSTTPGIDEVKDPDCEPTYPPPPEGPSARFDRPYGIAVDDWGNVYVGSRSGDGTEGRIDVFDPEGRFITELADPLGPWSITVDGEGNLYVFERLAGVLGAPESEIVRYPPTTYNPAAGEIAYDPGDRTPIIASGGLPALAIDRQEPADPADDRLYVADGSKIGSTIRIFSSAKDGNALLDAVMPLDLVEAGAIAFDSQRRIFYTPSCAAKCEVWAFEADAPYDLIEEIDGSQTPAGKFLSTQGSLSLAVDETNGHLFVGDLGARRDIFELDENYEFVSTFQAPAAAGVAAVHSDIAENPKDPDPADANPNDNYRHLYTPRPAPTGNALAYAPPAIGPPSVKSLAAQNIGEVEAEVEGLIHPNQLATTYAIEYVGAEQFAIDGFDSATVAAAGTIPGGVSTFQRVSAQLGELDPGQTYRFRITAENEANEGAPVAGEATFTTYEDAPVSSGPCPNDALRMGPSALLPDCRAWELVTPPEANGPSGAGFEGQRFGMVQASPAGNAVSFEVLSGLVPGTEATGGFFGDPYLATRTASGWSTESAGPTGTEASKPVPGSFSPDQGYSLWNAEGEGSATFGGAGANYVRYPDGRSELTGRGSLGTDPRAVGALITEGGTHIVFQTGAVIAPAVQLEPNAPPSGIRAVYDRTADEVTHVVSLLPGDVTPTKHAFYVGASADGEGIAFEVEESVSERTLYLRVGNEVTYELGPNLTFAGVSAGGERIFYVEGGDLKAFDTSSEEEIDFTGAEISSAIPVNVAPQGSRAYFVSETATGGANPNGEVAQPGGQNLYLSEDGAITFVATVTERDVEGIEQEVTGVINDGLGLWSRAFATDRPAIDPSRLTPDGSVFVFQSRASLDGYEPGEAPQIYRYDDLEGRLHCISCPPTEAPATGGAALQSIGGFTRGAPLSPHGFVPALSTGGGRLFFESTEALVSTDTDGLRDVYEWEEAGVGSCTRAGGCVYLISSGASTRADFLFGHSSSGDDVFIHSGDALVADGPERSGIYDARVGGGFAPAPPEGPCGYVDACRLPATSPPLLPQPGPPSGHPDPGRKGKKPCPKGKRKVKRKGKVVCVKKKNKARSTRGAGR